ncbi:MAG: TetR/AcrR family transcriptional regulator [Proteobacteria bacterium]|nr:TetR/AcrR family transcriptional regulator [Pseudomonadota bacterium]
MTESGKIGVRQERATQARRRLLVAAARLFSRRPYDEVEVDDIAHAAGMAHGSLFHHFGSKRGIYLAAMEEIVARLRERRAGRLQGGSGGLGDDMEAQYMSVAENPAFFVSVMRGGIGADAEVQQIFERDRWEAIEAKACGLGLDSANPVVRVGLRAWIAGADHAMLTWLELGRPVALSRLIESFLLTLAGTLDSIAMLDPSVDLSHARTLLRRERDWLAQREGARPVTKTARSGAVRRITA